MTRAIFRLGLAVLFLSLASSAFAQSDACRRGFVWRDANATDHVCVTPSARAEAAAENAAAAELRRPGGDACVRGYVWREANASDHVCVTPEVRAQTLSDNALASSRLDSAGDAARGGSKTSGGPNDRKPVQLLAMPRPPSTPGCFRAPINTDRVEWRQVPCLSAAELARLPHLASLPPGLQSPTVPWPLPPANTLTPGIQELTINVTVASASLETDNVYGPGAFSIQNNTNLFPVSCHPTWIARWLQAGITGSTAKASNLTGGPLPNANGAGLPNCNAGDQGWVQFTYQTYRAGQVSAVCIWNVDTSQQWYFYPQTWTACQNAGRPGFWTTIQIEGSVDATRHLLAVTATLPWSSEWVSVVTPDWLGLCWQSGVQCPWTQASGTILGAGNGSQAQYTTGTSIQTTVFASTCGGLSAADEKLDCGTIPPFNPYAATIVSTAVTAELNNLTTSFNVFAPSCAGNHCQQTFNSQK